MTISTADVDVRGKLWEIVNGGWSESVSAGELHGTIATNLILLLGGYVKLNKLGRVYPGNTAFVLEGTPENICKMRLPDVAFVAAENLKTNRRDEYYYQAPDVAIEIMGPSERASDTRTAINDYLKAGTRQVWIVYPATCQVTVHREDNTAITYREDDSIPSSDIFPFALPVYAIFDS